MFGNGRHSSMTIIKFNDNNSNCPEIPDSSPYITNDLWITYLFKSWIIDDRDHNQNDNQNDR
jgi:hypothetical protein